MGKKIFEVYLAKEDVPNNEAYAKLDLPASLWELWDALDKVRLQTDDILYMEIEDYDAFECCFPAAGSHRFPPVPGWRRGRW